MNVCESAWLHRDVEPQNGKLVCGPWETAECQAPATVKHAGRWYCESHYDLYVKYVAEGERLSSAQTVEKRGE